MRVSINSSGVTLWASAWDTERWATRPREQWPCSTLRGKRFCASFDSNGLVDLTVGGKREWNGPADELSACCADLLAPKLDKSHPAWFVAVGQFQSA